MSYLKRVSVFETVSDQFTLGHVVEPVEFTTTVLAAVERGKSLIALLKLRENVVDKQFILLKIKN